MMPGHQVGRAFLLGPLPTRNLVILRGGEAAARDPTMAEAITEVGGSHPRRIPRLGFPASSAGTQGRKFPRKRPSSSDDIVRLTSCDNFKLACHPERRRSRREGPYVGRSRNRSGWEPPPPHTARLRWLLPISSAVGKQAICPATAMDHRYLFSQSLEAQNQLR